MLEPPKERIATKFIKMVGFQVEYFLRDILDFDQQGIASLFLKTATTNFHGMILSGQRLTLS